MQVSLNVGKPTNNRPLILPSVRILRLLFLYVLLKSLFQTQSFLNKVQVLLEWRRMAKYSRAAILNFNMHHIMCQMS